MEKRDPKDRKANLDRRAREDSREDKGRKVALAYLVCLAIPALQESRETKASEESPD